MNILTAQDIENIKFLQSTIVVRRRPFIKSMLDRLINNWYMADIKAGIETDDAYLNTLEKIGNKLDEMVKLEES